MPEVERTGRAETAGRGCEEGAAQAERTEVDLDGHVDVAGFHGRRVRGRGEPGEAQVIEPTAETF